MSLQAGGSGPLYSRAAGVSARRPHRGQKGYGVRYYGQCGHGAGAITTAVLGRHCADSDLCRAPAAGGWRLALVVSALRAVGVYSGLVCGGRDDAAVGLEYARHYGQ